LPSICYRIGDELVIHQHVLNQMVSGTKSQV
jgi:hypothetical protein